MAIMIVILNLQVEEEFAKIGPPKLPQSKRRPVTVYLSGRKANANVNNSYNNRTASPRKNSG